MSQYQFCSVCGDRMQMKLAENDQTMRLTCLSCGFIHYHNPRPTVKAVIFKEDKILMLRRAEEPALGAWDIPGGFMEYDEHHDEAVVRETREETGVDIEIVEMLGVFHKLWNPQNVDSSILNICYLCRWVAGEAEVKSPLEIDRAEWRGLDNIPDWVGYGHFDEVMQIIRGRDITKL